MSRTPYKGDAEMAENERKCRFWLFGLYYGAPRPLQDRSGFSAHGVLRADIQSIFRWAFRLGFQIGRTSGLTGNSNHKWDLPDIPEILLINML